MDDDDLDRFRDKLGWSDPDQVQVIAPAAAGATPQKEPTCKGKQAATTPSRCPGGGVMPAGGRCFPSPHCQARRTAPAHPG
jgi:hypothetical protein